MGVTSVVMPKAIGGLLLTISLIGCSSTPYYADKKVNTYDNYRPVNSIVGLVYNMGKASAHSVPKESRKEHEKCVFMLLDNGNPGESCTWSDDRARGYVTLARIRPNLCHDLISTISYKGKQSSWQDTACLTQNNNWKFYDE